ncbi:MAG: xanthine dehydrogenase family protein molybdopterin-binding subunit [Gammaproteobacteria bacterium]|nr:xanthine dehydrogenase family protein molybdopterin-binding subunit [Gammaproteobacteria bacterium]
MAYSLIGKDYTPPDIVAKLTGDAKYAEDFKVDGMVFCRLFTSPIPHARVISIDASEALKLPGVVGVLTADDVPRLPGVERQILTNEPVYVGEPILAVAAVDEQTAEDAIALIVINFERLPFTVDPLTSLRPGGAHARLGGNAPAPRVEGNPDSSPVKAVHWTREEFAALDAGQLPQGEASVDWVFGDVESGFAQAAYIVDESFVTASNAHHSMEPRSAMSYWENGKCFLYGSSQSQSFPVPTIASYIGIPPDDLVFIAEFCGGGFGSKGSGYPSMVIPAHFAKKIGRPVMMRITREEEYSLGSARHGFQGRAKMGFRADGRLLAVDLYIIQDNGGNAGFSDWTSAGEAMSLVYMPEAMRFRGIPVFTNTPTKGAQRGPGQNQLATAIEPLLDKAARELGIDPLAIRIINAPGNDALFGDSQGPVTSAYLAEALRKGADTFGWAEKFAQNGQRVGNRILGAGVGQAYHSAGSSGFDGLVRITPDGVLHIHTGVGNLGTYSYSTTSRVAAEVLKCRWENCVVERGDSRHHLPWNLGQFGSNTSFTMTRTNHVAAMDALDKMLRIAALDLGGTPEEYDIADERVFLRTDPTRSLSYAEIAQRAILLGGEFSGQVAPEGINAMTAASVAGIAGTGLIGVARDNVPRQGTVAGLAAGFVQIALDPETGKYDILDYMGVADCGTILHPQGLAAQMKSAAIMGFGLAGFERHTYDPQNGLPANVSLHQAKPPSYMDVGATYNWAAVEIADPQNPVGAKGVGEPIQGCAAAALVCAISNAMGGHLFNRVPVTADMIINVAKGDVSTNLRTNT